MSNETIAQDVKTSWAVDASHSLVQFKVKHLMITTITGTLGKFEGTLETNGENLEGAKAHFTAEVASISTGDAQRDGHLSSADFFDVANHPKMVFDSVGFEKGGEENTFIMHGNLDFHGIVHPVKLDVEFLGINKDPWGNTKAGYTITGKLHRKDWGLNWNVALETGGWLVSDVVNIHADIQVLKQA